MRDNFTDETKRNVAARAGHCCSNPDCKALTSGPQVDTAKSLNVGVAAHITAASNGGPRFDPDLEPEHRCSADNAIWLCQNCAKLVDNDTARFDVETLRTWKRIAEAKALASIGRAEAIASASEGTRETQFVRVKYSSAQTVEISSAPGNYNESLNLDNVATMIQVDEASHDAIGMALLASPPLRVDKPTAEARYMDGGGFAVQFPGAGTPGMRIEGVTISGLGTKYLFDRFRSSTHIVRIGIRRFRVSLQSIRDKSSRNNKLIAYTFGISEE
jgi:hypothetical protein